MYKLKLGNNKIGNIRLIYKIYIRYITLNTKHYGLNVKMLNYYIYSFK